MMGKKFNYTPKYHKMVKERQYVPKVQTYEMTEGSY